MGFESQSEEFKLSEIFRAEAQNDRQNSQFRTKIMLSALFNWKL